MLTFDRIMYHRNFMMSFALKKSINIEFGYVEVSEYCVQSAWMLLQFEIYYKMFFIFLFEIN